MLTVMDGEHNDGRASSSVVPCVLLMLQLRSRTADELRELVAAFGFRQQAAQLESTLQRLRDDRLVHSPAQAGGDEDPEAGYELSAAGRRWLAARSDALAEPARLVARFLDHYPASGVGPAPLSDLGGSVEPVGRD